MRERSDTRLTCVYRVAAAGTGKSAGGTLRMVVGALDERAGADALGLLYTTQCSHSLREARAVGAGSDAKLR